MAVIDLRSDTVSQPSPAMRTAMVTAPLGDDGFGDDPTIRRLEALAAAKLGKDAGLFVMSGTMGNLISLLAHGDRGSEVIVGDRSHILRSEVAGAAALGRIQLRVATNGSRGQLDPAEVTGLIRAANVHYPDTAAVCLENSHNSCNGAALSRAEMAPIAAVARSHGLALHIDGARIFNAAVAQSVTPAELVADADSVQFCLSKGLACPIGSLIVGSGAFIERARAYRQMVGGTTRQGGVLAAAGIVALEEMIDRLAEDHRTARMLAKGLNDIDGISCDESVVETNILYYQLHGISTAEFSQRLAARGILLGGGRMVTHYGITATDIADALEAMRAVLNQAVAA